MTKQERLEHDQEKRYPLMRFFDCHGRWIRISNRMTLRRAIDELTWAQKNSRLASDVEHRSCGREAYAAAQEASKKARRAQAVAQANAQAAFYRYTGHWPSDLYDMGLR